MLSLWVNDHILSKYDRKLTMYSMMLIAKVQLRIQSLQFKGRLVYSKAYEELDEAANAITEIIVAKRGSTNVAMGFDLEWKTSFQRGLFTLLPLCSTV